MSPGMNSIDDHGDSLTIVVQPPSSSTLRRERRVVGRHRVRYRVGTEEWTTRLCLSLSKGGLFVATQATHEVGTLLYVELYDGEQWLRARARVQWRRTSEGGTGAAGMGLQVVTHHFADLHAWGELVGREQMSGNRRTRDGHEPMGPDAASWLAPPDEETPASRADRGTSSRVREAVLLVGMSCVSMALLLVR